MSETPLIVTCAVIGAELTREKYPALPLEPAALAESACRAVEAGASIVHLHVRDEQGRPTQRVDVFADVTRRIRERCDCILQYSTGGAVGTPLDERCAPLSLKPEMATLSMGTLNFGPDLFENTEQTIRTIAAAIREHGVKAELEIFDLGMLDSVPRYRSKGEIPDSFHVDFVLGIPGGAAGDVRTLALMVDRLPPGQSWSVAAVGRSQLPLTTTAIGMGGHVRVGLEDNIYYSKGVLAESNAQFVSRVARLAGELGRPLAKPAEARALLGLPPR